MPTTIEAPTTFDDIIEVPNLTYKMRKKLKKINLEIISVSDEPHPTEEMLKRQHELIVQARHYKVRNNESLVITKFQ